MSTAPERQDAPHADVAHAPGVILDTDSPLVGVLVEHDQRRLIALATIPKGMPIFRLEGRHTAIPTRYSIQVGAGQHLDPDDMEYPMQRVRSRYWMYLNHHCEPSAHVRDLTVTALRDIAPGDGVTFDYNTTESSMASPFDCHCDSAACVGLVRGANHLTPAQRARVESHLADYLR
jgi:hypothetical protein